MSEHLEGLWQEDGLEQIRFHRDSMVHELLIDGHLTPGGPVEAAFRRVPRELCVPTLGFDMPRGWTTLPLDRRAISPPVLGHIYDAHLSLITKYDEHEQPISSLSAPALVADMLEALDLEQGQEVLEIGAGSGYNAALIAAVTGARVVTVDIDQEVAAEAHESTQRLGLKHQVQVVHADGSEGYDRPGGWDRIIATVGLPGIPAKWLEQLSPNGVLVAPVMRGAVTPVLSFRADTARAADESLIANGVVWTNFVHAQGQLGKYRSRTIPDQELAMTRPRTAHLFEPGLDDARFGGLSAYLSLNDERVAPRPVGGFGPYALSLWDSEANYIATIRQHSIVADGPRALDAEVMDLVAQWQAQGEPSFANFSFEMSLDEEDAMWVPNRWHIRKS